MKLLIILLLAGCAATEMPYIAPLPMCDVADAGIECYEASVVSTPVNKGSFKKGAAQPVPDAYTKMCAKYPKPEACK